MTTCYHPEHRLFFIHIPKCAGTSIGGEVDESGNHQNCWLNDNLPGWTRDGLPNGHQPVRHIPMFTGQPIDYWDKIIVTIRNPFEQQLSQWKFWRDRGANLLKTIGQCHRDDRLALGRNLEQFVLDDMCNGPNSMVGRQWEFAGGLYRWWCEFGGVIPENVHIVRVEDLPDQLHGVLREYVPGDFTDLPVTNTTKHGEWWEYYTPAAIEHVLRKFAWAFATHYPDLASEAQEIVQSSKAISRV